MEGIIWGREFRKRRGGGLGRGNCVDVRALSSDRAKVRNCKFRKTLRSRVTSQYIRRC